MRLTHPHTLTYTHTHTYTHSPLLNHTSSLTEVSQVVVAAAAAAAGVLQQLHVTEVTENECERQFNIWRHMEVNMANDSNVSLSSCHGWLEMQTKIGVPIRLIGHLHGKVAGMVTGVVVTLPGSSSSRSGKRLEVAQLYVAPPYRGRGLSLQLLRSLCQNAVEAGATAFDIGVGLRNQESTTGFWANLELGGDYPPAPIFT